jgi:ribosomal-protein-alanine N-acetyltransferase
MGTTTLKTERLTLRRHIEQDAHVLFSHFGCNPKMFEFSGWNPYATEEMAADTVKHFIDSYEDDRFYGWAIEYAGELIGTVGAYDYDPEADNIEIGISIKEDAWGNGFATETLKCVIDYLINNEGIGSVVAWSAAENSGSIRAMTKAGMEQTSVEKEAIEVCGKKYDKVSFEVTRNS